MPRPAPDTVPEAVAGPSNDAEAEAEVARTAGISAAASTVELCKSQSRKGLLASLKNQMDGKQCSGGEGAASEHDGSKAGSSSGDVAAGAGGGSDGGAAAVAAEDDKTPAWSWRHFAAFCGPGLLMSVAYLDPGNLQADIQAGGQTGFALLWWFALVSLCCGTAFQCLSGRLGLVTGKDLARHCGERWPRGARYFLWAMMEFAIVAVDIQETVGCAQALYMLTRGQLPLWAGCIVVSCSAFILLLLERRGARWLEALFGSVIAVEAIAMAVNFFRAGVPAKEVALGLFRPTLPANAIGPAVGALGALVMPYNLFFHSAVVNSRRPSPPTPGRVRGILRYLRLETVLVLLGAFLINMCVICVFAEGFYGTEQEIGLQAAGDLLAERFGQQFKVFWAVGLLASGQISTVALTYAGQLVMSGLLMLEVRGWARMVFTRMVALVPALTVALVSQANNKFDSLNQMLNVVQSIQLPFALIPVIHMAANRQVMGPPGGFATRSWLTIFCGFVALAVTVINGYFLVLFRQDHLPAGAGASVGWAFLISAYYLALAYYAVGPERMSAWVAPYLKRAHAAASGAGSAAVGATARAGSGLVQWAKGINWRDPESLLEVHL